MLNSGVVIAISGVSIMQGPTARRLIDHLREKNHTIKELTKLIFIKFNSLASNCSDIANACFLFLNMLVTVTVEKSFLIKTY